MRDPSKISKEEKNKIRENVHEEAEKIGWHFLNNKEKSIFYDKWAQEYNVSRVYLKDRIMKGFDVRQGIPLKNEAAIQKEIEDLLNSNGISLLPQFTLTKHRRADLVFGFYENFPTHVVEIERADTWLKGFTQVLDYAADYFNEYQKLLQPMLILFGDISAGKLDKVRQTCDFSKVVLCSFRLSVKGEPRLKILTLQEYLGLSKGLK
ncbi:MAG: hypothetical protein GXO76_15255 [Calditrichaeota bacterium]|nr:hypothetical protein [Calditrichota bacterium]